MPTAGDRSQADSRSRDDGNDDGFTRLHITPFDAELLNIVVPRSLAASARNVSFHTIETFPEKRFGFVDLPTADAEKLKAKLNGSVLKGSKMRIQEAIPEVREEPAGFDPKEAKKAKKDKKDKKHKKEESKDNAAEGSSKKRKRDGNVVPGVTITDRKVQRGWTEAPDYKQKKKQRKDKSEKDKGKDKEKRSRTKSKYTEKEECLLKTVVPPNAMKNLSEEALMDKRRKKKKGSAREITIHEFEKTTKFPSFLKDTSSSSSRKGATEFVEGKGWVDEEGNVVEPVKVRPTTVSGGSKTPKKQALAKKKQEPSDNESDETSSSGTSSDDSSDDEESEQENEEVQKQDVDMSSETSSSGSDDEEEADDQSPAAFVTPKSTAKSEGIRRPSSGSVTGLKLQIPVTETPPAAEVHPLEALYKKKKPEDSTVATPAQQSEPFTFFGGNNEDEDEDEDDGDEADDSGERQAPVPMTPFTRQDFEERNIRSAAPTPDTAHPSRIRNIWPLGQGIDEHMEDVPELDDADEEEENEEGQDGVAGSGSKDSSDFQSWFWENRGELNRSWMKRRKMAAKEKRHRENKARANRAV